MSKSKIAKTAAKTATWLEAYWNVGLGAKLWAIELEMPREERRTWKFSWQARVVGRFYWWGILDAGDDWERLTGTEEEMPA